MTALFGIELFFDCLMSALSLLSIQSIGVLVGLVVFIGIFWNVMVKAYIFQLGVGMTFLQGVFIAIGYQLVTGLPFLSLLELLAER